MIRIRYYLFALLMSALSGKAFSQGKQEVTSKTDFLGFQSGFTVDSYNSIGIRTFFEYRKNRKGNWQYGISYEHTRHFGFFMTDLPYQLKSNLSMLSLNGYYRLNLLKDRIFWTGGLGLGVMHINWDDNDKFGLIANASLTLNVRITQRIYIETSPLIVFPPFNRIYFSPMKIDHFQYFYAISAFPFGLTVRL